MSWYGIFYWLTVADSVKRFFDVASNVAMFFFVISLLLFIMAVGGKAYQVSENRSSSEDDDKKDSDIRSWMIFKKFCSTIFYLSTGFCILFWIGYVATPTKKDCMLIIAGGAVGNFMVSDTAAKQIPSDITQFLHMSLKSEINELGDDTKRELGLQSPKEKLLDKAKKLTKEELVNFIASDTTLFK